MESFISTETRVKFQQYKHNDDNQKSHNQPIANVDHATSRVGLATHLALNRPSAFLV
jgi:hypothetical protein